MTIGLKGHPVVHHVCVGADIPSLTRLIAGPGDKRPLFSLTVVAAVVAAAGGGLI